MQIYDRIYMRVREHSHDKFSAKFRLVSRQIKVKADVVRVRVNFSREEPHANTRHQNIDNVFICASNVS